jgi:two-component system nitrogen regulation response regulator GlnG
MPVSDAWQASAQASTLPGVEPPAPVELARVALLVIAAHPDSRRIGERVALPALGDGLAIEISRLAPAFAAPGAPPSPRALLDPHLSRRPLRVFPVAGGLRISRGRWPVECLVDGMRLSDHHFAADAELERGVVLLLADSVALLLMRARARERPPRLDETLIGESDAMIDLHEQIDRIAPLEVPVLLQGETGTGKELVAQALHDRSRRRHGPFLAVNVAAIPPSLAAAEFFGAERGAFSGAERRRSGYFQRGDRGTLFLDEIGAASPETQDLLLRALELGEVQPVGVAAPQRVDVRVVSATDADLAERIPSGRFRAPLYHRLAGWEIQLPPLRNRRDDIGRLLVHFLRQELRAVGEETVLDDRGPRGIPWLPARLVARLLDHSWPGNVRELRNVARRLAVDCHQRGQATLDSHLERAIAIRHLTASVATRPEPQPGVPAPAAVGDTVLGAPVSERRAARPRKHREISEEELRAALAAHHWRLLPTAAALGISRTSLYAHLAASPTLRSAARLSVDEVRGALSAAGGDVDRAAEMLEVSSHGLRLRLAAAGLGAEPR